MKEIKRRPVKSMGSTPIMKLAFFIPSTVYFFLNFNILLIGMVEGCERRKVSGKNQPTPGRILSVP